MFVNCFLAAYAAWQRYGRHSTKVDWIQHTAEFVLSGDCTNPMFYAPPFGTNEHLHINDADMDNASQPCLDWEHAVHRELLNVLFADGHVRAYARFDPATMTHDTLRRGVAFGELPAW